VTGAGRRPERPEAGDIERLGTEALDPRFADLDRRSSLGILTLMNEEDRRVADIVASVLPVLAGAVDAIVARLEGGGRLVYAGAGTSGRLAMLDAVECVPTFGVPPTLVSALVAGGAPALTASVEGAEDDRVAGERAVAEDGLASGDVLVGIAASGRTPYVIAALRAARERGALTVVIVNNAGSPMAALADHVIELDTGPEVVAGSTRLKAGTAQKLVLNMLSTATMVRLGRVYGNRMIDVAVTNDKLRARATGIVRDLVGVADATASELLQAAGFEVRTAVLMGLRDLSAEDARRRLEASGGRLRDALDEPSGMVPSVLLSEADPGTRGGRR
jgi:N-acetylmuramic acid 6-phosphate etherase